MFAKLNQKGDRQMWSFLTFPQLLWISLGIAVWQLDEVQQPCGNAVAAAPAGSGMAIAEKPPPP
jgi:hypothetical protein